MILLSISLPTLFLSPQVPKVTQAHQAHRAHPAYLGPRALQVPRGLLEAEDLKALGSQTCSTASAQVTNPAPRNLSLPNSWASPRFCDQIF